MYFLNDPLFSFAWFGVSTNNVTIFTIRQFSLSILFLRFIHFIECRWHSHFHFCLMFHFANKTICIPPSSCWRTFRLPLKPLGTSLGPQQIWIHSQLSWCSMGSCLAGVFHLLPSHMATASCFSHFPLLLHLPPSNSLLPMPCTSPHTVTEHTSCPAGLLKDEELNKAVPHHPHST